jgi:hypothetical protein
MQHDPRISVWHMCLLFTLLYFWELGGGTNPVSITRRKVMQAAHIHSLGTYHKYINELIDFGYIDYVPSYDTYLGSLVFLNEVE